MIIHYLYNSGFAIELENRLLVFDYYRMEPYEGGWSDGIVPARLAQFDKAYVFISHGHADHFNSEIFSFPDRGVETIFIADRSVARGHEDVVAMSPGTRWEDDFMRVSAHPSTDVGVSFQVEVDGRTVFHAGDLNCWHWMIDNSEQEEARARAEYTKALDEISESMSRVDVAFFPVAPRMRGACGDGALEFLERFDVGLFIPMHFREDVEDVQQFVEKFMDRQRVFVPMACGVQTEY